MHEVIIVGGGVAGLTAALRLLERGYKVTVIERDQIIGGKFRSEKRHGKPDYHEHSFHLFLNWYNNFWKIADELGVRQNFEPRNSVKYQRLDGSVADMANPGSVKYLPQLMMSGLIPIPDMFVWNYSFLDLMAQPFDRKQLLSNYSLNAFLSARPYSTERAAELHSSALLKTFATPSFQSSAASYKNFAKYSWFDPVPFFHVMKGNTYEFFLEPWQRKLESFGDKFELMLNTMVTKLHFGPDNRAIAVGVQSTSQDKPTGKPRKLPVNGSLILAPAPRALAALLDEQVIRHDPRLGQVTFLESEPMGSLDLIFKKKLPKIPREHVVLLGSEYEMAYIDNSQIWPDWDVTFLNVASGKFRPLGQLEPIGSTVNSETPVTAADFLIQDLHNYVDFSDDDIDMVRTDIQTNELFRLFITEVGSWENRPDTTTNFPNMFLAGDFIRNVVDVVSLEGAVTSGLHAAEAVRQLDNVPDPVQIEKPKYYPELAIWPLKLAWMPYAYAAKIWSMGIDLRNKFQGN